MVTETMTPPKPDPVSSVRDTIPDAPPDREELAARAASLCPLLWEDAAENDRARRLTERSVAAITDHGLMRLMTPPRFGGHGTGAAALLDVAIALGRGCCSASWVTGVLNVGNFVASLFPEAAHQDVWGGDPNARTAQVLGLPARNVEPAEGGVTVTGEWAYMSGSSHAEWVCVLLARGAGTATGVHFALMPSEELEVRDTWHFTGMRGTGSNTVVAERVFVPEHRLLAYQPVLNGEMTSEDAATAYRNSLTGIFSIGLIGSLIGGAEAALRYTLDKAPDRPAAGSTYPTQADAPPVQRSLAAAATRVDSAKLHAYRIADSVDEHARADSDADSLTRARSRMESTRVAELCREAVEELLTAYGSSGFNEANPLQRIWRDIHVGSRHAGFGMGVPHQLYGHALVGKDPREISALV